MIRFVSLKFATSQALVFPRGALLCRFSEVAELNKENRNCRNCNFSFLDSYSKSFGETTHHREAYWTRSSPNSPILPRLVKVPPLEGSARHIAHQTFWKKAIPYPMWHFPTLFCRFLSFPDVSHQELPNVPFCAHREVVQNRFGIDMPWKAVWRG